jgi:hypothetical protein
MVRTTSRLSIPVDWHVPALFTHRLGDAVGRQRVMLADGHLLLVLHEPPAVGVPQRTGRLFWRDPHGAWRSRPLGDGAQGLKRHVAEFADRVEQLEKDWQAAVCAKDYFTLLRTVAPLHRTVRHLHATLQEARELVPGDRDLINLRDQVGEIERTLELLHGDAKNGLDFSVAHQAEQQAERTYDMAVSAHRLNLLASAFFPVATLSTIYSAIFGMILAHGQQEPQEWSTPGLFWFLLGLGMVTGLILARGIARAPRPIAGPAPKPKAMRR